MGQVGGGNCRAVGVGWEIRGGEQELAAWLQSLQLRPLLSLPTPMFPWATEDDTSPAARGAGTFQVWGQCLVCSNANSGL